MRVLAVLLIASVGLAACAPTPVGSDGVKERLGKADSFKKFRRNNLGEKND